MRPKSELLRQSGSLVFFAGRNIISRAIAWHTCEWSQLLRGQWISHVGFTFEHNGEILLAESTTLDDQPDFLTGKFVQGVQTHRLADRIEHYDGRVWVCPAGGGLAAKIAIRKKRLEDAVLSRLGDKYDAVGALVSGTKLLRDSWHFAAHHYFCSEFAAWALRSIGIDPLGHRERDGFVLPSELAITAPRNGFLPLLPTRVVPDVTTQRRAA